MAVFPCDFSRHRYREAQQSIYWTEVSEHLVSTYKLRLCQQHFREVYDYIREHLAEVDNDSTISDSCEYCSEPRLFMVSAKVFPARSDYTQWAIDLCARHASELGNHLHVYNGDHLKRPTTPVSAGDLP